MGGDGIYMEGGPFVHQPVYVLSGGECPGRIYRY